MKEKMCHEVGEGSLAAEELGPMKVHNKISSS